MWNENVCSVLLENPAVLRIAEVVEGRAMQADK